MRPTLQRYSLVEKHDEERGLDGYLRGRRRSPIGSLFELELAFTCDADFAARFIAWARENGVSDIPDMPHPDGPPLPRLPAGTPFGGFSHVVVPVAEFEEWADEDDGPELDDDEE